MTRRFLSYLAFALFVVPPATFVAAKMKGDAINWVVLNATLIGCWALGGLCLWGALTWPRWQPDDKRAAEPLGAIADSTWAWLVALAFVAFGPPVLVSLGFSRPAAPSLPPPRQLNVSVADAGAVGWAPTNTKNDWPGNDRGCSAGATPKKSIAVAAGNASMCDANKLGWIAVCWDHDPRFNANANLWPTVMGNCHGSASWCTYKMPNVTLATSHDARRPIRFSSSPEADDALGDVYVCTAVLKASPGPDPGDVK
jgi:hypothetical protein